jgi:hypothetical protein
MTDEELRVIESTLKHGVHSIEECFLQKAVAEVRRLQAQLDAMYAITGAAHAALEEWDDGERTLADSIQRLRLAYEDSGW